MFAFQPCFRIVNLGLLANSRHYVNMFSLTLVPLIMNNTDLKLACPAGHNAALCDVATTVLDVMGIEQAAEMTGRSLLLR